MREISEIGKVSRERYAMKNLKNEIRIPSNCKFPKVCTDSATSIISSKNFDFDGVDNLKKGKICEVDKRSRAGKKGRMEDEFQETDVGSTDMGKNLEIIRDCGNKWEAEICRGRESKGKRRRKKKEEENIGETGVPFQPLPDADGNKGAAEICEDEKKIVEEIVVSNGGGMNIGVDGDGSKGKRKIKRKKKEEIVVSNGCSQFELDTGVVGLADESMHQKFEPLSDGNGRKGEADIRVDESKRKKQRKKKEESVASPYFIKNLSSQLDKSGEHNEHNFEPVSDGNGNKGIPEVCGDESMGKRKKQRKKKEEIFVSPYFIKNRCFQFDMNMDVESRQQERNNEQRFVGLSDGDANKGAAEISGNDGRESRGKRKKREEIVASPYFIKHSCSQPEMNVGVYPVDESRRHGRNNKQQCEALSDCYGNKGAVEICGDKRGKRKREQKKREKIVASPYFIKHSCSQPEMSVGIDPVDESRRHGRNNEQQCESLSDSYGNKGAVEICGDKSGKRKRERKKREKTVASPYFIEHSCSQPEMNVGIDPVDESRRHGRNNEQQCESLSDCYGNKGTVEICGDKSGKRKRERKKREKIVASPHFIKNRCSQPEMNVGEQKFEALSDGDGIKGAAETFGKDGRESKGKRKKEKNVVSPYFMKNRCCHPTDESRLQGRNSKQKYEPVSDGDGNEGRAEFRGDENKVKKKREKKHSLLEKKVVVDPANDESRLGEKEIYSAEDIDKKNGKKKRSIEGDGDDESQKMENASLDDLFSRFLYTGGKSSSTGLGIVKGRRIAAPATLGAGKRVVSHYFANAVESGQTTVLQAESKVETKKRCSPVLTSAQKKDEAYLRRTPDSTWIPPRSPFNLLQEDHAFDPWRVLVICMLLNQTTGRQAGSVLPKLFQLCPNAKAATEVGTEEIEKEIRSLGLQKKRALGIQQLSRDYLDESWTHVTQLSGVGKYAADAYAIFCTGKWERVTPVDHKLVEYWNFLRSSNHLN